MAQTSAFLDLRPWWAKIFLLRRIVPSVMKRWRNWRGIKWVIAKRGGILWLLGKHSSAGKAEYRGKWEALLNSGLQDVDQRKKFTEMIQQCKADLFLDIGAFVGLYALTFCKQFPKMEIHAFEPHPENFARLNSNVLINQWQEKIRAHFFGAGAENATRTMAGTGMWASVAVAEYDEFAKEKKGLELQSIEIRTIDSLQLGKNRVIAVKMDTEMLEEEVLTGMKQLLAENKVLCQIEMVKQEESVPAIEKFGLKKIANIGTDYYFSNFAL